MAFAHTVQLGKFLWICGGEFDWGSLCIHRAIVDSLNLLLVFLFLLVCFVGKTRVISGYRRDWMAIGISFCCALVSFVYFGQGLWKFISSKDGSVNHLSWLQYFVCGIIWITLTVSLLVQGSKWIQILISSWWVIFFLLISTLNIEVSMKTRSVPILDQVTWLVTFLIFLYTLLTFYHIISQSSSKRSLVEPLLVDRPDYKEISIGQATLFGKLSFSWVNGLIGLGNSKTLALEDIPCLGHEDEAISAYKQLSREWKSLQREDYQNNSEDLLIKAIARVYWKQIVLAGALVFLRIIAVVISPLMLYAFVAYSSSETRTFIEGVLLLGCLVVDKLVDSLSSRHFFFYSRRVGMRIRSVLMVAVYQKQLQLSSLGRHRHSTGEIVNYIAVDAYRMGESLMWFHTGWSSGLQIFLAVGVLFGVVGLGAIPGLVSLIICGLLNVPFVKILQKCQTEFMIAQDKRLRFMSEILNSMKIIKLQSWEENFKNSINSHREDEFKWLAEAQIKKAYSTLLYWMSPTIVSCVIFLGLVFFRSAPFDAATIFTVLAALRTMSEPVKMLPEALSAVIQVKVSFDRINSFLLEDEIKPEDVVTSPREDSEQSVCIVGGHFTWDPQSPDALLKNLNFQARRGQKIAVCGPVGAGKSSFLYAILGEIPKTAGIVHVYGSIAYVSQSAWIQSGTVRDNILFGRPMDDNKYHESVKVSALDKDIDSFDYGDLTEIGQRGLNMSGGQKQRIQLARAVYSDADIYVLDDPFSAVDAHTAVTLFNDCVMTALKNKTVILVTHQVEFLSEVDRILVMEDGQITQSGSYNELLMSGMAFEQLVNAHIDVVAGLDPLTYKDKHEPYAELENELEETDIVKENSQKEVTLNPGIQLTQEEEKESQTAMWKIFLDYVVTSKGSLFLCSNILTQASFVAFQAAASYWLAVAIQSPKISHIMVIGVYSSVSLVSAFFVYLRSLFAALLGLKASKAFFSGFTNSIFNAPMLFFDSTPVGRILTRASSDLSVLDYEIPFSYAYVVAAGIELLVTIGIMASVTWQVLLVGIIATVGSKYVQEHYQPSAQELMRINGTTKAPVMNYVTETSLGVATIRAFGAVERFFQNYLTLVDADAKVFLCSNGALEWLVLRTEALQNITLFTASFLLVSIPKGYVSTGLVGLSLSYALALTNTQVFLSRWYSNLANYVISAERIKQFMCIPPEPPAIVEDNRPPLSWPTKGRIELLDLKIRYRPNAPLVLKGITCTFREGTRVGVVGRTGSGKTTLISALFRLVEPYSGQVIIDDTNICSIGLKDLRLKLSIIPQEPTLFKGSVRTNLDPLGLYSDDEIWKALEKCQLKATISILPNLLDSSVSDEGKNWSTGQRQLFCLGRVLLRRNRILVLDEATASIDSATDAILQRIIREEFSNCTVITVAHRVPTVIDSDMVMVLSFGELVEYDQPSRLMQTNSSFAKLVAEYWSSCRRSSLQKLDSYHIS
ncbi:ABC transporter C family member 8 isoform X2 [Solanum dulcamara]|uniref:ABC transporter C family member 8 isoform X2 n=1 Tax=Solanum dulcamara TaxID=45834 RepID=UPI0024863CE6|nr:ABC transporter C family member 8 isoform X2 [Solanum dulcamara]